MLLTLMKIPILIAAFWIWRTTANDIRAAQIWAVGAFITTFAFLGFSGPVALYGAGAFLVAWAIFTGLSYVEGRILFYPLSLVAALILLGTSWFLGF